MEDDLSTKDQQVYKNKNNNIGVLEYWISIKLLNCTIVQ